MALGQAIVGEALLPWLLRVLVESSLVIVVLLLIERVVLRGRVAALRSLLWPVAAVRLLVPPGVTFTWSSAPPVVSELAGVGRSLEAHAIVQSPAIDGVALLAAWGAVAVLLLAREASRARRLRSEIFASTSPAPVAWQEQLAAIAQRIGLRRVPALRVHARATPAFLFGVRRPVVSLAHNLSHAERHAALWHECLHIARRDPLVAALWRVLGAIWWMHPLLPWAARRAAAARELACDAAVDRHWRGEGRSYRRALLEAAGRRWFAPQVPHGATGWLAGRAQVLVRLASLERPLPRTGLLAGRCLAPALVLVVVLAACGTASVASAAPAWWNDADAAREEAAKWCDRRPGLGCTPGRLVFLRAVALERAAQQSESRTSS